MDENDDPFEGLGGFIPDLQKSLDALEVLAWAYGDYSKPGHRPTELLQGERR